MSSFFTPPVEESSSWIPDVSGYVSSAYDSIPSVFSPAVEESSPWVPDVTAYASSAYNNTTSLFSPAVEESSSWVPDVAGYASSAYDSIPSVFSPAVEESSSWIPDISGYASSAYDSIPSVFSPAVEESSSWVPDVAGYASSAYDSIPSVFSPAVEESSSWIPDVSEYASSTYNSMPDVAGYASDAYDTVKSYIPGTAPTEPSTISDYVSNAYSSTSSYLRGTPAPSNGTLDQLYQVATGYFDTISTHGQEIAAQFLDASMAEQATVVAIAAALAYAAYNYKAIISSVKNAVTSAGSWVLRNAKSATTTTSKTISELFALISLATIKLGHQILPYSLSTFIPTWIEHGISLHDYVGFVGQAVATNQTDALDSLITLSTRIILPKELASTTQSTRVIPENAAMKIMEQIVRPSVPAFIVDKFLNSAKLGPTYRLMTAMKEKCKHFSLLYQAEVALIFGKYGRVGALSVLQRQPGENIEPKFLTFYRLLIEALFTPNNLGDAFKRLNTSYLALGQIQLKMTPLHLQLLDLFVRESQCLLSRNINPSVCPLAVDYVKLLIQRESIVGTHSPHLAYMKPATDALTFESFFNAQIDDYAMLAAAIRSVQQNSEALKHLNCGGDAACKVLKDLAAKPPLNDPCDVHNSKTILVENMPQWIDAHAKMDNNSKEKFVAGLVYMLANVHPDNLPKWVYYKQSLADAFNGSIKRHCDTRKLNSRATMNHL
jgi:hypothetical protein